VEDGEFVEMMAEEAFEETHRKAEDVCDFAAKYGINCIVIVHSPGPCTDADVAVLRTDSPLPTLLGILEIAKEILLMGGWMGAEEIRDGDEEDGNDGPPPITV